MTPSSLPRPDTHIHTRALTGQVTADLTPLTSSKVTVQFKTFTLFKLINITAPPAAKGEEEAGANTYTHRLSYA